MTPVVPMSQAQAQSDTATFTLFAQGVEAPFGPKDVAKRSQDVTSHDKGSITWVEVKTGSPIAKKLSGTADSSMFLGYLG